MGLTGNEQIFFDMLQWFSTSLRQHKQQAVHYLDGLAGCGNSCEVGIRTQFFKILEKLMLKMRLNVTNNELKLLLENLCWIYKAEDHESLAKLGVFEFLSKGDGSDLSWVKYYQGRYLTHGS